MAGHFQENAIRSKLSFGEKALAVEAITEWLLAEGPKSQRELAEALTLRGLPISQSELGILRYAATRLYPLIPNALLNDLGRPGVRKVKRIESTYRALWRRFETGPSEEYDEAFQALIRRRDAEWDIEALQRDLDVEVAERGETSIQEVRLAAESHLKKSTAAIGDKELTPKSGDAAPQKTIDERVADLRAENYRAATVLASAYAFTCALRQIDNDGVGYLLVDLPSPEVVSLFPPGTLSQFSALGGCWWGFVI